jgi:hypothetical protein
MSHSDTSPEIEKKQILLLRRQTFEQRLARAVDLSDTVRALSRNALRQRHPELTGPELNALFVELHYGKDLAQKYRHATAAGVKN